MTTPVSVLPAGVLGNDGSPAAARVCSNTRVLAASGALGLVTDVMQFAGPAVSGSWIVGASRVQVNGVAVVNQAAVGVCVGTPGVLPPGPMSVAQGDARIKAQ